MSDNEKTSSSKYPHKLRSVMCFSLFLAALFAVTVICYLADTKRYQIHDAYTVYLSDDSLTKIDSFNIKKIVLDKNKASVKYFTDTDTVIYSQDGVIVIDKGGQVESYSNAFIIKDVENGK